MLPKFLPMTVFEEYMLLDGTTAYPMECHCRYRFSGSFDHSIVEEVMASLLSQNPFLYARCREMKKRCRYAWEIPEFGPDTARIRHEAGFSSILGVRIYWLEGKCREAYPQKAQESLDLFSESMIRFYFVEEKDASGKIVRTDLVLKCHHSASDGKGIFRFIADFLIGYARALGTEMPEWERIPKIDVETLVHRKRYGRTLRERLLQAFVCTAHLVSSFKLITHPIQPLLNVTEDLPGNLGTVDFHQMQAAGAFSGTADPKEIPGPAEDFPKLLFEKMTRAESGWVLQRCHEKDCTFNDVMLEAVFVGTKSWRAAHPAEAYAGPKPWLRIAVPFDLRHPSQAHIPACNIVSMYFCDRKESRIEAGETFRKGISAELKHAKKWSLGFLLIQSLKDARKVCGNLHGCVKLCDCWSTMVLTNLGSVYGAKSFPFPRNAAGQLQIGDLVLEEIDSASPIRPQTNLSICCMTYGGEMQFSMIYDSRLMEKSLAADYLQRVLESLRSILR